jgi:hypothetical protein
MANNEMANRNNGVMAAARRKSAAEKISAANEKRQLSAIENRKRQHHRHRKWLAAVSGATMAWLINGNKRKSVNRSETRWHNASRISVGMKRRGSAAKSAKTSSSGENNQSNVAAISMSKYRRKWRRQHQSKNISRGKARRWRIAARIARHAPLAPRLFCGARRHLWHAAPRIEAK